MKHVSRALLGAVALVGLFWLSASGPVLAQAQQAKPSAAAIGYAKEILAAKNAPAIYRDAVPGLVERVKIQLLQNNLNYQKDLNEVAIKIAKDMSGRENEIGEQMAVIYASVFTEVELKDLAAFYKSPLGKKVIEQEPVALAQTQQYMQQWAGTFSEEVGGKFRSEMKARGKDL
jgi:hypothetical protein